MGSILTLVRQIDVPEGKEHGDALELGGNLPIQFVMRIYRRIPNLCWSSRSKRWAAYPASGLCIVEECYPVLCTMEWSGSISERGWNA
jgi:hypothetical protein